MSRPTFSPLFALVRRLGRDEAGFILSAELVLIATIIVIGLVVGLSEISSAVNAELFDVARSYGSLNTGANGRYGALNSGPNGGPNGDLGSLQQSGAEAESGGTEMGGF
jgi:hypothetical protein